jgi:hypothetical protein
MYRSHRSVENIALAPNRHSVGMPPQHLMGRQLTPKALNLNNPEQAQRSSGGTINPRYQPRKGLNCYAALMMRRQLS